MSRWRACIAAVGVIVTGCGHLVQFPAIEVAKPPAPTVAAPCPSGLLADLEPLPPIPANVGFPAALTPAEGAAISSYLVWLHALAAWGRAGWQRASDVRVFCLGGKP